METAYFEGTLQVKKTTGGWRHYILLGDGRCKSKKMPQDGSIGENWGL